MDNRIKNTHQRNNAQFIYDFLKIGLLAAIFPLLGSSPLAAGEVIEITGNDMMKYDISNFEVTAGQEVTIVFKNIGKS